MTHADHTKPTGMIQNQLGIYQILMIITPLSLLRDTINFKKGGGGDYVL